MMKSLMKRDNGTGKKSSDLSDIRHLISSSLAI